MPSPKSEEGGLGQSEPQAPFLGLSGLLQERPYSFRPGFLEKASKHIELDDKTMTKVSQQSSSASSLTKRARFGNDRSNLRSFFGKGLSHLVGELPHSQLFPKKFQTSVTYVRMYVRISNRTQCKAA